MARRVAQRPEPQPETAYSVPAVAEQLGVRNEWVYVEIRSGRLPAVKLGDRGAGRPTYRVRKSDLDRYLAERLTVAPAEA